MDLRRLSTIAWLLPAAFIVHDSEEIITMPDWIRQNREALATIAKQNEFAARVVDNLAQTTVQVAVAVVFELLLILLATVLLLKNRQNSFGLYLYSAILGVFFLHTFTHAAQALFFGGYTPGVLTALLVIPPTSLYLYRQFFQMKLLTWKTALLSALTGVLLILPVLLFAHFLGRTLLPA